jgi:hypothetical protein
MKGFSSFIFVLVIVSLQQVYPQVTETQGNLLRINFTSPTIDFNDTLWSWTNKITPNDNSLEQTLKVYTRNGYRNLLTEDYFENNYIYYMGSTKYSLLNINTKKKTHIFGFGHVIDIIWEPYCDVHNFITQTNNGVWFLYGISGSVFVRDDDSVFSSYSRGKNYPTCILGKINDNYLIAVKDTTSSSPKYDFYLEDLDLSPQLKLNNKIMIDKNGIEDDYFPYKIVNVKDSLYLMQSPYPELINLISFSNGNIKLLKRIKDESISTWSVADQKIFYEDFRNNGEFVSEDIDLENSTLANRKVLISNLQWTWSMTDNTIGFIRNDSLLVYSYKTEKYLNRYDLSSIRYLNSILIDSPYVYIHQILSITDVPKEKTLPTEFVLKGNYPNPFNPSTTINFVLPKRERVMVKIFNALGQLVCNLVNEEKEAGDNYLVWNGRDNYGREASSGIYFYRVQAGKNFATGKMVLQK